MKTKSMGYTIIVVLAAVLLSTTAVAAAKPNIVLINMDNFGYGELGAYGGGITRGAPTPTTSCKMADSWTSSESPTRPPFGRPSTTSN